jgi:hypothetical protein
VVTEEILMAVFLPVFRALVIPLPQVQLRFLVAVLDSVVVVVMAILEAQEVVVLETIAMVQEEVVVIMAEVEVPQLEVVEDRAIVIVTAAVCLIHWLRHMGMAL